MPKNIDYLGVRVSPEMGTRGTNLVDHCSLHFRDVLVLVGCGQAGTKHKNDVTDGSLVLHLIARCVCQLHEHHHVR